ncbi:hypothetical protein HPB51_003770 [Rhipicephalus microplus]|uniref:DM13 domain-containing protein n=1 Tax=Rhipicephalus microplus TaxID=6941 RepID=A0A9J6DYF8_RHIMP|nr:hypothetical protein HPB51_003770 [Rhipicephalus microplus]
MKCSKNAAPSFGDGARNRRRADDARSSSHDQVAKRSQRPRVLGDCERPRRFRGEPMQFPNWLHPVTLSMGYDVELRAVQRAHNLVAGLVLLAPLWVEPAAESSASGTFAAYHGKFVGKIVTYYHNLTGTMYAATNRSVVITHLHYDGMGPAAYFWASQRNDLDESGDQLLDENQSPKVLKPYHNATVLLILPRKVSEYKSLGVYCKLFGHDVMCEKASVPLVTGTSEFSVFN